MTSQNYFRDDKYFDSWHPISREWYYKLHGYHAGILYKDGKYQLILSQEIGEGIDYEFEDISWHMAIIIGIEQGCLEDMLFDMPDLKERIENTTAKDYQKFYEELKQTMEE